MIGGLRIAIYAYLLQTDRDAWMSGGELMGAVLNTGLEMDQGIQKARALIQPTRVARYIDMVIGATRTGESFATYEVSLKTCLSGSKNSQKTGENIGGKSWQ